MILEKEIFFKQIIGHKTDNNIEGILTDFYDKKGHDYYYPNSKIKWRFNFLTGLSLSGYSEKVSYNDILDIKEYLIFEYKICFNNGNGHFGYNKQKTFERLFKKNNVEL